jgi:hypothetical protein
MGLAPVLAAALWVPMRWFSADPAALDLLEATPVNCVLLEREHWSLIEAARSRKLAALAVIRREEDLPPPKTADGIVIEGDFAPGVKGIHLASRARIFQVLDNPVAGTFEGVWPGLRIDEEEPALTGPTAAPWLDTNSGFLRFVRAMSGGSIWMGNRPPPGRTVTPRRRLQAVADAALAGARWILALDEPFARRLVAREAKALEEWREFCELLSFIEKHASWRAMAPYSRLALVQEINAGALVSGGAVDMLAVQHLPVWPLPSGRPAPEGITLTIKAPAIPLETGQYAVRKQDLEKLEPLWREVKEATTGRNFGVRVFNASGMLSNALISADGKKLVVLLVNYTDYPAEALTIHALGKWTKASLLEPGKPRQALHIYSLKDGTGIEIDRINVMAAVELE